MFAPLCEPGETTILGQANMACMPILAQELRNQNQTLHVRESSSFQIHYAKSVFYFNQLSWSEQSQSEGLPVRGN